MNITIKKFIFPTSYPHGFNLHIPLLPSPKDLVPQKHGGEKTMGFSKNDSAD
jgi:hypothetical protein